jgi:small subunit ribosomal protein S9
MAEKKPVKEAKTYYIGTGRRKTAVARVRVTEGKGTITINGRSLDDYFTEDKDRAAVLGPLKATDQVSRLDVTVLTNGGGITGQAGAVCQGLARAIKTMFSPADEQKRYVFHKTTVVKTYRDEKKEREKARAILAAPAAPAPSADGVPVADEAGGMVKRLRDSGFLTRDARMKERKKYGLRGARRGTQFSKR